MASHQYTFHKSPLKPEGYVIEIYKVTNSMILIHHPSLQFNEYHFKLANTMMMNPFCDLPGTVTVRASEDVSQLVVIYN